MSRREFLSALGVVFLSLVGIPAILTSITELSTQKKLSKHARGTRPFGSGGYGV